MLFVGAGAVPCNPHKDIKTFGSMSPGGSVRAASPHTGARLLGAFASAEWCDEFPELALRALFWTAIGATKEVTDVRTRGRVFRSARR